MTPRSEGVELCPRVTSLADRTGHVRRPRSRYGPESGALRVNHPTLASRASDTSTTTLLWARRVHLGDFHLQDPGGKEPEGRLLVLAPHPTQTTPPAGCPLDPPLAHQPRPRNCRFPSHSSLWCKPAPPAPTSPKPGAPPASALARAPFVPPGARRTHRFWAGPAVVARLLLLLLRLFPHSIWTYSPGALAQTVLLWAPSVRSQQWWPGARRSSSASLSPWTLWSREVRRAGCTRGPPPWGPWGGGSTPLRLSGAHERPGARPKGLRRTQLPGGGAGVRAPSPLRANPAAIHVAGKEASGPILVLGWKQQDSTP